MEFEPVIGLEVHVQLKTDSKIFCGCSTKFGAPPNTHTCPVCLGFPGVLPVLNKQVVNFSIRCALAINCKIARESKFDRKNYFYPDLPKGYQITQFHHPIAEHGFLNIEIENKTIKNKTGENKTGENKTGVREKKEKQIGITRIHLEEDAGKLTHAEGRSISMVDLNRAGVPLIEIVSEPDISSPEEAGAYLRKLHSIVRYIDICDGNMEEGSFRCDANISLRPKGQKKLGTRAELKNLNSFKYVEKAIVYEINRQTYILEEGGSVIQETRLWDTVKGKTVPMRGKEEAHDYRYFPEPDLLSLIVEEDHIKKIQTQMPELPEDRKKRFIKEYRISEYDAGILTSSRQLANYFEECTEGLKDIKLAVNWIIGPFLGLLKADGKTVENATISAKSLKELLKLMENNTISNKAGKTVFERMAKTGESPEKIVKDKGLVQVTDRSVIEAIVEKIITVNPNEFKAFKDGKNKLAGFFVGQVMKESKGKANPKMVNEILNERKK